jgi:hypothetical protein
MLAILGTDAGGTAVFRLFIDNRPEEVSFVAVYYFAKGETIED